MTQQEIQERNKQIALMLGAVPEQWYPVSEMYNQSGVHFAFPQGKWYPDNNRYHSQELLKFHSNWNWLMEAVTKVYSLITPSDSIKHDLIQKVGRVQKEAVFIAVSDFASLYNQKKL